MEIKFLIQALVLVSFPAFALWGAKRYRFLGWLSPVVLCYSFGLLLAHLSFIEIHRPTARIIIDICVPLAIPMLLFATDFVKWLKLAPRTVFSFVLVIISTLVSVTIWSQFFAFYINDYWQVAGMLVGVYIGGTPNMGAIHKALQTPESLFIKVNISEVLLSIIYLFFLLTIAQRILHLFLPRFIQGEGDHQEPRKLATPNKGYFFIHATLAIIIVLITLSISQLLWQKTVEAFVILGITTLGIGCSFYSKLRNMPGSYELGNYLLLIFCTAAGVITNIKDLNQASTYFFYCAAVLFTAIIFHYLLAAIFRIDADTTIITSTAGIFGAPFIPAIAYNLKNREIIVSGLTTALAGYALANYLGISIAIFLRP